MASVDAATVKRLTFIRMIHQQAIEQSQRPEPLSVTSILTFHDAIELFLVLAGEHLNASTKGSVDFIEYWSRLAPKTATNPHGITNGVSLTGKSAMDRLNKIRRNFKHAGVIPGSSAVQQVRDDVNKFFTDNTPLVFGPSIDFQRLDMSDLVTQDFARRKLQSAAQAAERGDYQEAVGLLAEAFDDLLYDYSSRKKVDLGRSVFGFGQHIEPTPTFATRIDVADVLGGRIADHYLKMADAISEMQSGLRVIALGLDYRNYARFTMITPRVRTVRYNVDEVKYRRTYTKGLPLDEADYEFCRDFVVTTSLTMAEVDFDLDLYEHRRAWRAAQRVKSPTSED